MEYKIKDAFDQIKATPDLKNQTAEYVLKSMSRQSRKGLMVYKSIAAAVVCMLVLLIGGYQMYNPVRLNVQQYIVITPNPKKLLKPVVWDFPTHGIRLISFYKHMDIP